MATARKKKTASRRHRLEPDALAASVGKRVRALRAEREIGFDALVSSSGLGRGYISELERGLVVPTVGTLARLAVALDVTLADLVIGSTERERLVRGVARGLARDNRPSFSACRALTDPLASIKIPSSKALALRPRGRDSRCAA